MRETIISNAEKHFVTLAISEEKRVDGRGAFDFRKFDLTFGTQWGSCQVLLGETRVFAQVSCQIEEPKDTRPNEGQLFINVEMSPMAASYFEPGRNLSQSVEVNRLVERCLKDSRCVDLESLCIIVEEKAWTIRVDIHVLNHDGNLADAACLAGLASLMHFKRSEITLEGKEITVHPVDQRDPVPLTILHYPLCLSFAFFAAGSRLVLDPTELEERVMDGRIVLGINPYRELCTLQLVGKTSVTTEQIIKCGNIAAKICTQLVQDIKDAVTADSEARSKGPILGLAAAFNKERITSARQAETWLHLANSEEPSDGIPTVENKPVETEAEEVVQKKSPVRTQVPATKESPWITIDEDSDEEDNEKEEDDVTVVEHEKPPATTVVISDDSEEETTTVVSSNDLGIKAKTQPQKRKARR